MLGCITTIDVVEKVDLSVVLKTAKSVWTALGIKLGKSWEAYVTELHKFLWTNLIRRIGPNTRAAYRILRVLYDGLHELKWKEFGERDNHWLRTKAIVLFRYIFAIPPE